MKKIEVVSIKSEYLSVDALTKRETYDPKILKMLEEDIAEHGFREEHPLVVRPNKKKRGGLADNVRTAQVRGWTKGWNRLFSLHKKGISERHRGCS